MNQPPKMIKNCDLDNLEKFIGNMNYFMGISLGILKLKIKQIN